MRNIALKLSVLACLFFVTSCIIPTTPLEMPEEQTLTIVNNSSKVLRFFIDTSLTIRPTMSSPFGDNSPLGINPYTEKEVKSSWKDRMREDTYISRLFLFDKTVLDNVLWDTIRANNMYLKRIDFTLKTLDSLNWTLTYP